MDGVSVTVSAGSALAEWFLVGVGLFSFGATAILAYAAWRELPAIHRAVTLPRRPAIVVDRAAMDGRGRLTITVRNLGEGPALNLQTVTWAPVMDVWIAELWDEFDELLREPMRDSVSETFFDEHVGVLWDVCGTDAMNRYVTRLSFDVAPDAQRVDLAAEHHWSGKSIPAEPDSNLIVVLGYSDILSARYVVSRIVHLEDVPQAPWRPAPSP